VRWRPEHVLELAGGCFRLLDPLRRLRDPERDELGAQLVQVAGERGLLGNLAERGDRHRVADEPPIVDGPRLVVEREPRLRLAVGPERAHVDAASDRRRGGKHPAYRAGRPGRARDALEILRETHRA